MRKRILAALLLTHTFALAAMAQGEEFGRGSGPEIDAVTKERKKFSGSFGISTSTGQNAFGLGSGRTNRYEATLGGALAKERVWFFASAQQSQGSLASRFAPTYAPGLISDETRAIAAKLTADITDRQNLTGSFRAGRENVLYDPLLFGNRSASFLTLNYTGIVSDSMFVTARVSQQKVK